MSSKEIDYFARDRERAQRQRARVADASAAESRRYDTIEQFNELVHIGWQASLPAAADNEAGFRPVIEPDSAVDIANRDYQGLPQNKKKACLGTTSLLTAYMNEIICRRRPIDETVMLEGRERVYQGWVHGRYGNPVGGYDFSNPDDKTKELAVVAHYSSYDELVPPKLQRVDENILCLGFMALRNPQIFTWVADQYPDDRLSPSMSEIDNLQGIQETELRGQAAVKRVVRVSGHATTLQAALLEC